MNGVKGIAEQVNDHLLELRFIPANGREIGTKPGVKPQTSVLLDKVFQKKKGVGHALVEVDQTNA